MPWELVSSRHSVSGQTLNSERDVCDHREFASLCFNFIICKKEIIIAILWVIVKI